MAEKSPVLILSDKRLEAGKEAKCNCLVERGGHENAAPAAPQVLDCNGSPNGRISRSPWRAGLVSPGGEHQQWQQYPGTVCFQR
jgi:hypothetical protein